ncbi:MAG: hypothetical protein KFH87_00635 [Bacteroidetes bacterium]|nr:hypothetical protein [Bacteroidota bacterium]
MMIILLLIGVALLAIGIVLQSRSASGKKIIPGDFVVLAGELFIIMTIDDMFGISKALATSVGEIPELVWLSFTLLAGLLILETTRKLILGRKYADLFP